MCLQCCFLSLTQVVREGIHAWLYEASQTDYDCGLVWCESLLRVIYSSAVILCLTLGLAKAP